MPFNSLDDVENRLANSAPLTPQETRDLIPWMNQISETGMRRLTAHSVLQSLEAAQKFDRLSSKLAKFLIGPTIVLAVLTIAILYNSFAPVPSEKTARPLFGASGSSQSATEAAPGKKKLGPWKVKFSIPGSAELPEKNAILKCSFDEAAIAASGFITLTVANLSDRSYSVRLSIFGYDQDGRRISQGDDEFAIGKRETVLRKIFLLSQQSAQGQFGPVFWIQAALEE